MKRRVLTIAILISLAAPAWAGILEAYLAFERGDYETALREFRPLAEQGHANAQYNLGLMYDEGRGVPQDYAEAVKWYRKAAEQGTARAQANLGTMYANGHGVPRDYGEAVKLYKKAAEQGNAVALNNLGFMYDNGRGVPQDYVQAHMWFNLAVSNLAAGADRDKAVLYRDIAAGFLNRAQIAEAPRRAREWKPKQEGE